MENGGETGDDHGSGWFEVKKKNRVSSKLSIQQVSGGSLVKTNAYSPCNQVTNNDEAGKFHSKRQSQPFRAGFVSGESPDWPLTNESGKSVDKVDANQENEPPKKPVLMAMTTMNLEGGIKEIQEVSMKKSADDVPIPKIKWGDLEDESLIVPGKCVVSSISEKHKQNEEDGNLQASPSTPLQEDTTIKGSQSIEQFPSGTQSSVLPTDSVDLGQDKVRETPMEGVELDSNSEGLVRIVTRPDEAGKTIIGEDIGNVSSTFVEEAESVVFQRVHNSSVVGSSETLEEAIAQENVSMKIGLEGITLLEHHNTSAEDPVGASGAASIREGNVLQNSSVDEAELGEVESAESKERFRQRLWCFLFENLNRAVDELYLLCELECDVEQMDEAILVLEEATSDFRELKSRVENFETIKRSPSQSPKTGTSISVKTDHRRPHALSWEVRRMTNSPHRAEILSSSLEAFKKIQMERAGKLAIHDAKASSAHSTTFDIPIGPHGTSASVNDAVLSENLKQLEKQTEVSDSDQGSSVSKNQYVYMSTQSKVDAALKECVTPESLSASVSGKSKRGPLEPISETQKQLYKKDKLPVENRLYKQSKTTDVVKRPSSLTDKEKEKEKRNSASWKSMDAWKEKRNWEDILKSPMRTSSRVSHSPGMSRKGQERTRVLRDKLMSPEKRKKSALDMKREAEEKHARAMRIRNQLENERVQRLQRTSEKVNRVNEWQAVRSLKLREGMYARHQRSESRHEAYLAQVVKRAGDESSKVNEVRFITSLNEENKKLMLRQKLHDSEMRRAEKLQVIRTKQKEDIAREEAVLERRKLLEAEKLQRLAETQRKKEEAHVRREEERKASSAAREARVMEQLRRKEVRAKAQQEEAELLALKLAERLRESEQRRKFYLEQIREKASMDFRDQSSPLLRRSINKDGHNRSTPTNSVEDFQTTCLSSPGLITTTQQQSLKRRIKKIRQRLMALKHEFAEPSLGPENTVVGYRALVGGARAKIGRWLQDLQRHRQARKEGAASIGLIVGDMVKFLEGREPELHASRQAGLVDFIASALPASHTSKPEACQVTVYLLRLLRVVLSLPANRSYFLVQNLLPPIIPMLSASLENYIKIAASSSPGSTINMLTKASIENLESISEILDGFLWTVTTIVGHAHVDERQLQMQDGNSSLMDLFALYDRPQVEGAPFPSSILLSLNLLTVLTCRPASISSIDWESCVAKPTFTYEVLEASLGKKSVDSSNSSLTNNPLGDSIMVMNPLSGESDRIDGEEKLASRRESMSDVFEGRAVDVQSVKKFSNNSVSSDNAEAVSQGCMRTALDETQNVMLEEQAKLPVLQKDGKNPMDDTSERKGVAENTVHENIENKNEVSLKQPVVFLLSAVAETGLVSLPSLLTAVLLQANSRMSTDQASYVLPMNFEEVATGVLKISNNLAILDITLLQSMLARSDLKMEFFHLMSFLLSHCTTKWRAANDQVGLLLLESLLLLGYFALFHPENQEVLRWGKSPPFFTSDPELTPILAGTLVAACYGCDQNRGVVQQELSMDMLLSLLKFCRQGLLSLHSDSSPSDNSVPNDPCDINNQLVLEAKKPPPADVSLRSNRRNNRVLGRGGASGGTTRGSKTKNQRDNRGSKTCDEWALKHSLPASEASSTFMLHRRFPSTFLDKAEEFFSAAVSPV
ncbi:hypothetical protein J5N97_015811 [Dioscorea zingiberensis]|uniref:S phase cyclin A-associated protein in the endoplasmic reticulum N-terminal domain-containing protein n=1 Tax=Dioscorea zingiberensis TaxID=325984 RepID=A0A9D5HEL1_9LILI|nr:hypothetical protein J5N97_015811 [Dioscorea zingiberensis]